MTPRRRYGLAWLCWALLFAVLEWRAVRHTEKVALCNYLRPLLGIGRSKVHTRAGQVGAISFIVWFARHLYREKS